MIYTSYASLIYFIFQVAYINGKIKTAGRDSPLYKLPLLEDPSNEMAEVLVKSVEWNMLRGSGTSASVTCPSCTS
jgi:hypothetical protein